VSEDGVPPAIWVGKLVKHQILGYSMVSYLIGGFNPSEKYEFVSWDDDSQYIEKQSSHVPNHQPAKKYHSKIFSEKLHHMADLMIFSSTSATYSATKMFS